MVFPPYIYMPIIKERRSLVQVASIEKAFKTP